MTSIHSTPSPGSTRSPGSGDFAAPASPPLDPPRAVPAGNGWTWLKDGWELFREAPGTWVGIILVWFVLSIVLTPIPLAVHLLTPVFQGGLMLGCQALAAGRPLTLDHLFAGFRRNFGSLVLVGTLTLAGTVAAFALAAIIGMITLAAASVSPDDLVQHAMDAIAHPGILGGGALLAVLAWLTVALALAMAVWFAPALVVLHDLPAVPAMLLSLRGCLANLWPFLVWGIGVLALAILASIPFGLGWLVLAPVLAASTYAAYREIFTRAG